MQIKTKMRYYYTPIRMAKIKISDTPKAGEDEEKLNHSYIAGEYKMVQLLWKTVWQFLLKTYEQN